MYGQFFAQLLSDIKQRYGYKDLGEHDRRLIHRTVEALQHRARRRAIEALVRGIKGEKRYATDVEFKHRLDMIVNVVVRAAFGDVPVDADKLGEAVAYLEQQITPLSLGWVDEIMAKAADEIVAKAAPFPSIIDTPKPVTKDDIMAAWAGLKPYTYKSGLPAAKKKPLSDTEAMAELLKIVEQKAEQIEKDGGKSRISAAEAKKLYPNVFGKTAGFDSDDALSWEITSD
jgi:hypothetical protein